MTCSEDFPPFFCFSHASYLVANANCKVQVPASLFQNPSLSIYVPSGAPQKLGQVCKHKQSFEQIMPLPTYVIHWVWRWRICSYAWRCIPIFIEIVQIETPLNTQSLCRIDEVLYVLEENPYEQIRLKFEVRLLDQCTAASRTLSDLSTRDLHPQITNTRKIFLLGIGRKFDWSDKWIAGSVLETCSEEDEKKTVSALQGRKRWKVLTVFKIGWRGCIWMDYTYRAVCFQREMFSPNNRILESLMIVPCNSQCQWLSCA